MKVNQLKYNYPEHLVAVEPVSEPRVMLSRLLAKGFEEGTIASLKQEFRAGDHLVLNDTRVLRRRLFASAANLEILFLDSEDGLTWEVLFPARKLKINDIVDLGEGLEMKLLSKGRPQRVRMNQLLTEAFFDSHGELPLPPYIQRARNERHMRPLDSQWYQTAWAESPGSYAAPTASLHFSAEDIVELSSRGVHIHYLTLHVGLGTFLPVKCEDLDDHKMHSENVVIPAQTALLLDGAKTKNERIWCLGTTVARALEAWKAGHLWQDSEGDWQGGTQLFIQPGFKFLMTDVLMTNFHQPESTLLALVCAFAGHKRTLSVYQQAIAANFRLFSYGDLTVWMGTQATMGPQGGNE